MIPSVPEEEDCFKNNLILSNYSPFYWRSKENNISHKDVAVLQISSEMTKTAYRSFERTLAKLLV